VRGGDELIVRPPLAGLNVSAPRTPPRSPRCLDQGRPSARPALGSRSQCCRSLPGPGETRGRQASTSLRRNARARPARRPLAASFCGTDRLAHSPHDVVLTITRRLSLLHRPHPISSCRPTSVSQTSSLSRRPSLPWWRITTGTSSRALPISPRWPKAAPPSPHHHPRALHLPLPDRSSACPRAPGCPHPPR
jgi:hypothetical protein